MSYELLLNDSHGIHVPQMFAEEYFGFDGVDQSDMEICRAGPEHKNYWDAWENILQHAYSIDKYNREWFLFHDGNLWAFCPSEMTEEDEQELFALP